MDEATEWVEALAAPIVNVHAIDTACAAMPAVHVWEV